MYVSVVNEEFM